MLYDEAYSMMKEALINLVNGGIPNAENNTPNKRYAIWDVSGRNSLYLWEENASGPDARLEVRADGEYILEATVLEGTGGTAKLEYIRIVEGLVGKYRLQ